VRNNERKQQPGQPGRAPRKLFSRYQFIKLILGLNRNTEYGAQNLISLSGGVVN
jgi:hypothetical protein